MKSISHQIGLLAIIFTFIIFQSFTQYPSPKLEFSISDPPIDGFQVGKSYPVKGKILNIPEGHFLWVFVHRIDFEDVWYPQFYDTDQTDSSWKVMCTFGNEEDIGWDFEIAVAIINNYEHIKLKEYRKKAMRDENWTPIEMPPTSSPLVIRRVEKIKHN